MRIHFVCRLSKARNTYPDYVLIIAFPRKQWLSESACYVYKYIACFVLIITLFAPNYLKTNENGVIGPSHLR